MAKALLSKKIKIIFWIVLITLSVIGIYLYWQHNKYYPSTDNAYVGADVVQIAPEVSGPIIHLYVKNFDKVVKGQPLLDIDPALYEVAVDRAESQLQIAKQNTEALKKEIGALGADVEEKKHELRLAEQTNKRIMELVHRKQASLAEGDKATRDLKVAESGLNEANNKLQEAINQLGAGDQNNAQIRSANAELNQAKLNLGYTKIIAPATGYIVNLTARTGSVAQKEVTLFSLVDETQWWVDANFKETELERIRPGQAATIVVDMYPDHTFNGFVQNISSGSGAAFSLFPAENATGNWVKITQRFPVRIYITDPDSKFPLRIGASSHVKVDTTKRYKNHGK